MREIKFRVWDKDNKEWLKYKQLQVGWKYPGTTKTPVPVIFWFYTSQDGEAFNELQYCLDSDHFEVCQYTGLQDKNGQDIYEGDIVEVKTAMGFKERGIVKFVDGCFEIEFFHSVIERDGSVRKRDYVKCYSANRAIKAIGNIHENPELLD